MEQRNYSILYSVFYQAGQLIDACNEVLESGDTLEDVDKVLIENARSRASDIQDELSGIIENPQTSITD